MDRLKTLIFVLLALAATAEMVEAVTFNGVTLFGANARVRQTQVLACNDEGQIDFYEDTRPTAEWLANDGPDFNITYTWERTNALDKTLYITAALVSDDRDMSGDWSDRIGNWKTPRTDSFYANNRTSVLIEELAVGECLNPPCFQEGNLNLGKIHEWNRTGATQTWVKGLNHSGTYRMVLMVVQRSGLEAADDWFGDSDQFDTSAAAGCALTAGNQRAGFLRASANVTSFRTSVANFSVEERKYTRGENITLEFNLSANASVPSSKSGWSGKPANITLIIQNSTSKVVVTQPFAINSSNTTFRMTWMMPDTVSLANYNVTINVSTLSGLLTEPWTNLTSTSAGFINRTHAEIPTQTGLDPTGATSTQAAFWVNGTLGLIFDANTPRALSRTGSMLQYLNRGEYVQYSMKVLDGWNRPFVGRGVNVSLNATHGHCFLKNVVTNTSGGTGLVSHNISTACEDSYLTTTAGTAEERNYTFHLHFPNRTSDPGRGAFGFNDSSTATIDIDSRLYASEVKVLFGHIMRGDSNRFNATVVGPRNDALNVNVSVGASLSNPNSVQIYSTNVMTANDTGVTRNWDPAFANSDVVGGWFLVFSNGANTNVSFTLNNSMSSVTSDAFKLNNTITVNGTSLLENNLYSEPNSTTLKSYNKNESINISAILYHSDGGFYRIKKPTGDTARTVTVQAFNNTYGQGAFENTSVAVSATTGRIQGTLTAPVTNTPNDTYADSTPGVNESREYDLRFYDGGTTSSAANGNDANRTNQFDVDDDYYVNATVIPTRQFNKGGSNPEVDYRITGTRGQYISLGTGRVRLFDPSGDQRSNALIGFNNGWLNLTTFAFDKVDEIGSWDAEAENSTGSGGNIFANTYSDAFNYTDELTVTITNNDADGNYNTGETSDFDIEVKYANGTLAANRNVWPWWNRSFGYRQNITIDNTKSAIARTNYPIQLKINTQNLTSLGRLRSDAADIRFVDADGTELSYWIETRTNHSTTKIWVKMPTIAASSSRTISMYYGYPSAESKSSLSGIFTFSDDYDTDPALTQLGGLNCAPPATSYIRWNSTEQRVDFREEADDCATDHLVEQDVTDFRANATRFHFNATIESDGDSLVDTDITMRIEMENNDATVDQAGTKTVGEETGLDVVFTGRYNDAAGTGETATVTRDGSAFQGYIEVAFNDTHLMLYVFNDTGDLLDLKNTSFSHTAASQWATLRFRRIGQVSVKTNDYYGWLDDFVARPFTFPEPSFALGIEENLNHTTILDATLQNATPSRVKHEHFDNKTNANGKYFENDYTLLANDDGTWRINATARFENNTGRANITFTVNGVATLLSVQTVATYDANLAAQGAFEEDDNVTIRTEVTHSSGAALIFGAFINITAPNGTKYTERVNMTNIASITVGGDPGFRYEHNFTIPADPSEGVWTIDVFANSTDSLTDTGSGTFDVVVFRDIDINLPGSTPFTLRIGSQDRARKGPIPIAGG